MQMTLEFSDAALRRIRDHHFVTSMRYVTVFDEETCENAIATFKDVPLRLTTKLPQGIGSVRTFKTLMTDKKAGLKADSKAKAVKEDAELVFSLARLMGLIDDSFECSVRPAATRRRHRPHTHSSAHAQQQAITATLANMRSLV